MIKLIVQQVLSREILRWFFVDRFKGETRWRVVEDEIFSNATRTKRLSIIYGDIISRKKDSFGLISKREVCTLIIASYFKYDFTL